MTKLLVAIGCLIVTQVSAQQALPDSIYTYSGKNKALHSGAAIHYDENGRKVLEDGRINRNSDDVLDEKDQAYKIEFVYTQTGDRLCVEEIYSQLTREAWRRSTKRIQIYTTSNLHIPIAIYDYTAIGEDWNLFANTIGTEFDEKGRPVVLMDSSFYESVAYEVMRMEVTYNEHNWPETILELTEDKDNDDVWLPFRKRRNVYNELHQETENLYYYPKDDGSWYDGYKFLYTYDEEGNVSSMIRVDEGEYASETYYRNVYLSGDDSNDVLPEVSRKANVSLTDGRLCVKWADDALFDVAIYNMSGLLVMRQPGNRSEAVVPVSRLAQGVYVVKVTSGTFMYSQKIVKR